MKINYRLKCSDCGHESVFVDELKPGDAIPVDDPARCTITDGWYFSEVGKVELKEPIPQATLDELEQIRKDMGLVWTVSQ